MGCHFLLQGTFGIQGLNPDPPHCRQILYRLSHQGNAGLLSKFILECTCSWRCFLEFIQGLAIHPRRVFSFLWSSKWVWKKWSLVHTGISGLKWVLTDTPSTWRSGIKAHDFPPSLQSAVFATLSPSARDLFFTHTVPTLAVSSISTVIKSASPWPTQPTSSPLFNFTLPEVPSETISLLFLFPLTESLNSNHSTFLQLDPHFLLS